MASFEILTQGNNNCHNITQQVTELVRASGQADGLVSIFLPSTTSALTIMEHEAGAIADLQGVLEKLVPADADYQHNAKWGDVNGYAHVRSALMKPTLTVPLVAGEILLGNWQSIVLIDFDNQQRTRTIYVTVH